MTIEEAKIVLTFFAPKGELSCSPDEDQENTVQFFSTLEEGGNYFDVKANSWREMVEFLRWLAGTHPEIKLW